MCLRIQKGISPLLLDPDSIGVDSNLYNGGYTWIKWMKDTRCPEYLYF